MLFSVTTMSIMTPNMDVYGHLGGVIGGFLLAIIMADMHEDHRPEWYDQAKRFASLALLAVVSGCAAKIALLTPHATLPPCKLIPLLAKKGALGKMLTSMMGANAIADATSVA